MGFLEQLRSTTEFEDRTSYGATPQHERVTLEIVSPDRDGVEMSLSEFADSGLFRKVNSKILGERVIFAADNAEIPPGCTLIVYRASELAAVTGMEPKALRRIHAVKKEFDGELQWQGYPIASKLVPSGFSSR